MSTCSIAKFATDREKRCPETHELCTGNNQPPQSQARTTQPAKSPVAVVVAVVVAVIVVVVVAVVVAVAVAVAVRRSPLPSPFAVAVAVAVAVRRCHRPSASIAWLDVLALLYPRP